MPDGNWLSLDEFQVINSGTDITDCQLLVVVMAVATVVAAHRWQSWAMGRSSTSKLFW
jgi:hypothetical protein